MDAKCASQGSSGANVEVSLLIPPANRCAQEIKMRQDLLPHALAARFDYGDLRTACTPNTRMDILSKIDEWVDHGKFSYSKASTPPQIEPHSDAIFWLNGPGSAGTGKTTIAFTVAQKLYAKGILGASFFCSRNGDCSDPQMIFPTIAYQLGQFHPPFKDAVLAVLRVDPDIVYASPLRQLEKLIIEPLEALRGRMPFCVVILDALDECQHNGATFPVLISLGQFIARLIPIQFLVTSRPERHITHAFKDALKSLVKRHIILHYVERPVIQQDIEIFLREMFKATKKLYSGLGPDWPSVDDVAELVNFSSGLFIVAATAAKFIQDRSYDNPQGQLSKLIAITPGGASAHQLLDELYLQVLQNAFPAVAPELASGVKAVLGSIVLAYEDLSQLHLRELLNLDVPLPNILHSLESILVVPPNDQDSISVIHTSFREFLVEPRRCTNSHFLVKPTLQHTLLARSCFRAMTALTNNICGISDTWNLHNELDGDFTALVSQKVSSGLQYASLYWARHLTESLLTGQLLDDLKGFSAKSLLQWLEVCSLLGELRAALLPIKTLQQYLLVSS